ncbi:hypothetical protein Sjap_021242 [Stephania japonica]|uniref:Uncharacterized protein n=1 Tax=Stephania japonica TaxID=461633 RepID=A0AAP0HTY4_9MAGN
MEPPAGASINNNENNKKKRNKNKNKNKNKKNEKKNKKINKMNNNKGRKEVGEQIWIKVNIEQTSFYRVKYDDVLATQLKDRLYHSRYRITEGVNLPFRVLPTIKELGRTRMKTWFPFSDTVVRMIAKVADFGFPKYAPQEGDSGVSLEVRGTAGYLDPEYQFVPLRRDGKDITCQKDKTSGDRDSIPTEVIKKNFINTLDRTKIDRLWHCGVWGVEQQPYSYSVHR